jgi:hypothetical protein
MHKTLKEWRAKRAGGRITVYGKDATTGAETKIVSVDSIQPSKVTGCIAVDKDGTVHQLLPA